MLSSQFSISRIETVEEVIAVLLGLLESRAATHSPVVAFDLDGTLWRGDLGYGVLELAEQTKMLSQCHLPSLERMRSLLGEASPDESLATLIHRFESSRRSYPLPRSSAKKVVTAELPPTEEIERVSEIFALCTGMFFGVPESSLRQLARDVLSENGDQSSPHPLESNNPFSLRPDVAKIRAALARVEPVEVVVTATAQVFAREAATRLRICPSRVKGVELAESSDHGVLPVVRPSPIHRGKGEVLKRWCRELGHTTRPFLSVGDSPLITDFGLLLESDYFLDVSGDSYVLVHNEGREHDADS